VQMEKRKTMTDYINREDTIKTIESETYRHDYLDHVIDIIEAIPSADVAPIIHGDWKEEKITFNKWGGDVVTGKTLWRCSVCGHEDSILTNYCSKCGARMDGEEDEIDRR